MTIYTHGDDPGVAPLPPPALTRFEVSVHLLVHTSGGNCKQPIEQERLATVLLF